LADPLVRLVVFRLEEQRYGLPLAAVERVLPMVAVATLPKAPAVVLGVINVGGRVIDSVCHDGSTASGDTSSWRGHTGERSSCRSTPYWE
jgi:hypothetical protein